MKNRELVEAIHRTLVFRADGEECESTAPDKHDVPERRSVQVQVCDNASGSSNQRMPRIASHADEYQVADAEWVHFEDLDGYVLLKCNGDAIASNELIAKLSAIPPEAEVYVEIPVSEDVTQRDAGGSKRNPVFLKAEEAVFGLERSRKGMLLSCVVADDIPVSHKDKVLLMSSNIIQNIIFTVIGGLIAFMFPLPDRAQIGFGVFEQMPQQILLLASIILGVAVLAGVSALMTVLQKMICSKAERSEREIAQRRSIIGEIMQSGTGMQAMFFTATGIGEEALFRAGLISVFCFLEGMILDVPVAGVVVAAIIADVIFTLCHLTSYKDFFSVTTVFLLGAVLTLAFLITGSIIAGAVAHAVYDFLVVVLQKRKMNKEGYATFFDGKRPVNILEDKENGYVFARKP